MSAVAEKTKPAAVTVLDQAPPALVSETGAIIAMIERAASNPNVDIEKMERLFALQERAVARQAEQAYNDAMAAAQAEMRPIAADASNPQTKSKYASHAALDNALRPIYTKHGFSLGFNTEPGAPENHVRFICKCRHRAGHTELHQIEMPTDGKGAKGGDVMTKTHAVGAGATYGQRYLLKMVFNIAVGTDNDGNKPQDNTPITEEEVISLRDIIRGYGADESRVLAYVSKKAKVEIKTLAEIPASHFEGIKTALGNWANRER